MRKTKLISLPKQTTDQVQVVTSPGSSSSSITNIGRPTASQETERSSLTPQITQDEGVRVTIRNEEQEQLPTMADFMSFNRITFNPSVQPRPVNQIHEERQRNRESTNQRMEEVPRPRNEVEFGYLDEPLDQQRVPPQTPQSTTMPRQLGRRTHQSPRIVSIDAESNTVIIDQNLSRPTSAPGRVGLVPRGGGGGLPDSRRSVRQRGATQFDSMSSVASSRNPSPVSLLSSSESSMTSARNESTER